MAAVEAGSCSSYWTPSLGTCICCRCSPKKRGKEGEREEGGDRTEPGAGWGGGNDSLPRPRFLLSFPFLPPPAPHPPAPPPQVFDNTPAALDGTVAAGDEITGVNGRSIKGKTKVEVAKMIQEVKVRAAAGGGTQRCPGDHPPTRGAGSCPARRSGSQPSLPRVSPFIQ